MRKQRALNSRPLNRLCMALALTLGAGTAAQAQSLLELYDAARAYDATYLAARAQADSAQYRAAQADALARPTVGVGATAQHQQIDPPTRYATVNGQQVQVAGERVGATTVTLGLSAKYALYNRGNALSIEQAQRGLGVAAADLEVAEQDLIVRVSQAYFDVLAARDALATARANRTGISEQLASAKRNFEVGTATITDTREAQARFDIATASEIAAENDLRVKGIALDTLVGRVGVSPKPLAVPVALPALAPVNLDPWVNQAEEQHPQVRKAKLGLEVAQLETGKARAADGVTVDMTGSIGPSRSTGAGAQSPGTTTVGTVGIQINYPLYTGGYNQNRLKETLALEEKSRNDLDYVRRLAAEGTKRAYFNVQSLAAQAKALEAAEASSKLALDATQLGYKVGVRVNLDVLNAQTQLFSTQRDLAKARYDTVMMSLRLRQASGQLKPDDIAAVNQLLAK